MKKSIFLVMIILAIIIALPILGNSSMKKMIDERLIELKSYGLETTNDAIVSDYLTTSRHFEFFLQDAEKFIEYLNKYSDKQLPAYVNAAIVGVHIGVDVKYNNIPFTKEISVEIYPLTLSEKMETAFKKEDTDFYKYIDGFLQSKGILYHIDYNMINQNFKGFVKDIKETYTLKDGTELSLNLQGTTYKGSGKLIAPDKLKTSVKMIHLSLKNNQTNITFNLNNLKTTSNFESISTYLSTLNMKNLKLIVKDKQEDFFVASSDVKLNISSNIQGKKAELMSASSMKTFIVKAPKLDMKVEDIECDISLNGLNKEAFEKITLLVSKAKKMQRFNKELIQSVLHLISKGFEVKIPRLSVKNIVLDGSENLQGFSVKSTIKVHEDAKLTSKINIFPLLLVENIDMDMKIKLSDAIYTKLLENVPMASSLDNYVQMKSENAIFNILFKDTKLQINGEALN